MPNYTGINHLALVTRDMEATIRFWRDFLGMRLVIGLGAKRYRHYFFEVSKNDMIAFFEWPEVESIPEKDHGYPVKGPLAFDHVSIGVDDDEALWQLIDKFKAADRWVSEIIDHGFIHSIYAFDPNRIPIEFSAPVPGVDLRRSPAMKDPQPVKAAMEGADPQTGKWPDVDHPTPQSERRVYPGEGKILVEVP